MLAIFSNRYLQSFVSSIVIPYLLFIKLPFDFIFANKNDISFFASHLNIYFILFISFFLILFLFSVKNLFFRKLIHKIGIFYFIFIIAEEILINLFWPNSKELIILIFLAECIFILYLARLVYKLDYQKLVQATLIAFIFIFIIDCINFSVNKNKIKTNNFENFAKNNVSLQNLPNDNDISYVYHLVLDGFTSHVLNYYLKENNLGNDLEGYTFFKNNKANYGRTHLSVPSYLIGEIYKGNSLNNYEDFNKNAWINGYPKILEDNQIPQAYFTYIRSYFNTYICNKNKLAYCDSYVDKYTLNPTKNDQYLPLDMIFFNSLPVSARYGLWRYHGFKERPSEIVELPFMLSKFIFSFNKNEQVINNNEVWSKDRTIQSYSYNGFIDFLEWDNKYGSKVRYKYIHLLLPHGPYTRDMNCKLKKINNDALGSIEHHGCAIHIIKELNNHLKKLGRYDKSTIIINSDHGSVVGDFIEYFPKWDKSYYEESQRNKSLLDKKLLHKNDGDVSRQPASQVELRAAALLLLKEHGKGKEKFTINEFNSQLIDLYPTIISAFNINYTKKDGLNLNYIKNVKTKNNRIQVHHVTNENTPEDVTKLQSYKRDNSGWVISGQPLIKK